MLVVWPVDGTCTTQCCGPSRLVKRLPSRPALSLVVISDLLAACASPRLSHTRWGRRASRERGKELVDGTAAKVAQRLALPLTPGHEAARERLTTPHPSTGIQHDSTRSHSGVPFDQQDLDRASARCVSACLVVHGAGNENATALACCVPEWLKALHLFCCLNNLASMLALYWTSCAMQYNATALYSPSILTAH